MLTISEYHFNKTNTNWNTNYIVKEVSGSKTLGKWVIDKIGIKLIAIVQNKLLRNDSKNSLYSKLGLCKFPFILLLDLINNK